MGVGIFSTQRESAVGPPVRRQSLDSKLTLVAVSVNILRVLQWEFRQVSCRSGGH